MDPLGLKNALDEGAARLQVLMDSFFKQLPVAVQNAVDGITLTVSKKVTPQEPPKEDQ